jgi:glycosyltransferase involved in cell wall biosynthesis
MTDKRILLVGDGNHQFITNCVRWLKKQNGFSFCVDMFSLTPVRKENVKFYQFIYQVKEDDLLFRIVNKIKGVRRFYRFYLYEKLIADLHAYDIIHFHGIDLDRSFMISKFIKKTKSKIVLTIWGSEMYRVSFAYENCFVHTCKNADHITFTNKKSLEYFCDKYRWRKNNLSVIAFGLAPLEYMEKITLNKVECKEKLRWNKDKLAITIGYNMAVAQQHLSILEQFGSNKLAEFHNKIQLIVPITYGGDKNYKREILTKLNQLPFEFKVYDEFLDDETVACIRKGSDVLIQLQITDQFSGSMQEHLFARNVVTTGRWLPYDTLKEKGAYFIEIDKVQDLNDVLPDVINNFSKYEQKTTENPRVISELSSWEKNIKQWIEMYNSL